MGINAELVTEFAKDKVWEESKEVFNNQAYIFGKQFFRISRCENKVDVIITDSPILLSVFYNNDKRLGEDFNKTVSGVFKSYNTLNYMLLRDKPYNPKGRFQTEQESDAMVSDMCSMLDKFEIIYSTIKGNQTHYDTVVKEVVRRLEMV